MTADRSTDIAARAPRISGWRAWLATRAEHVSIPAQMLLRLAVLVREALPVGLLRTHEIVHVVRQAYSGEPDFYDPDQYRLQYEVELLPILERHGAGKNLLDLFCGQGREAALFAAAGYRVHGVDESTHSVEKARAYLNRRKLTAEFSVADIHHYQPGDADWDVIYKPLWMFSCIPDRTARVQWATRVREWLGSDGLLVVSTKPRPSARAARVRDVIARIVARVSFNARRPELGDRFHQQLFWHDFENDEVVAELAQAGLEVRDVHEIGGYTPCTFFIAAPAGDKSARTR